MSPVFVCRQLPSAVIGCRYYTLYVAGQQKLRFGQQIHNNNKE